MARIKLRVQPGAKKNEVVGFQEGVLKVKVTAPPVEGKANAALVSFLAQVLKVRKSGISIVAGQTGRDKIVEVEGLAEDWAQRLIAER